MVVLSYDSSYSSAIVIFLFALDFDENYVFYGRLHNNFNSENMTMMMTERISGV